MGPHAWSKRCRLAGRTFAKATGIASVRRPGAARLGGTPAFRVWGLTEIGDPHRLLAEP